VQGVSRNRLRTPGPAPPETHESLISRKTVAEVPLTGLSFAQLGGMVRPRRGGTGRDGRGKGVGGWRSGRHAVGPATARGSSVGREAGTPERIARSMAPPQLSPGWRPAPLKRHFSQRENLGGVTPPPTWVQPSCWPCRACSRACPATGRAKSGVVRLTRAPCGHARV
jgi:hypothetical protein